MTSSCLPTSATLQEARRRWLKAGGAVALAAILAGCGHKNTATAVAQPPSADQAAAPEGSPDQPAAAPVTVAAAADGGADLKDLNHAYIRWIVQSHQRAKTFEEFVAASGTKVPPRPPEKNT